MAVAFVFPGQGSQAVGMGKALAAAFACARAVFEEVDAALADKLSAVMWEGPTEKVTLTENAQPALVAVIGPQLVVGSGITVRPGWLLLTIQGRTRVPEW